MSLLRGLASAVACAATPGSRFVSLDATKLDNPHDLEGGKAGSDGADDDVMVFLLAGQSNMVGRGNGSALSKKLLRRLHSLSDPTKDDSPIGYYAAGLAGASSTSYNDSVCSMGIEHRQKVFDLRSSAFQPIERMRLAPVDGCAWEKAIFRLDTHFGPEISLGLALNEQWPTRRIVLSKRALSGSTLATGWTPGTDGYRALPWRSLTLYALYGTMQFFVHDFVQGECLPRCSPHLFILPSSTTTRKQQQLQYTYIYIYIYIMY